MKRIIYISLFSFLGLLVSFIVHGVGEIGVIALLAYDFETYGLGLTWEQWEMIHLVAAILLPVLGILLGFQQGRYWWRIIYRG